MVLKKHLIDIVALFISILALAVSVRSIYSSIDAEERQLRAYISAQPAKLVPTIDHGKPKWHLIVGWNNDGSTPTRALRTAIKCGVSDSDLDHPIDWSSLKPRPRTIGAKRSDLGGDCWSNSKAFSDQLTNGTNHVAAVALYKDIFGASHITEQCMTLRFDPTVTTPEGNPVVEMDLCAHHNCADEECGTENEG